MLIDVHTHIFPSKIAPKTIKVLEKGFLRVQHKPYYAHTDGTVDGLRQSMKEFGVDKCVVLPIATTVKQSESINQFAISIDSDDVRSFGSVHPMQSDYDRVLEELAEHGIRGIKLHADYQDFYIDCKESIAVLKKAEALGLYVTLHSGVDFGQEAPQHCTPERLHHVLQEVSGENIICAHMGSYGYWDDAERYLVGTPVMMDTASVCEDTTPEQYKRIIENHGADKIMFGTDSPWWTPGEAVGMLESLGLPEEDVEKIKWKNALRLFWGE